MDDVLWPVTSNAATLWRQQLLHDTHTSTYSDFMALGEFWKYPLY